MPNKKKVFIHEIADVQTQIIGEDTRVWQYSIILAGAKIGSNCNINAHCFIGINVTVKCGVYLWDGITIEDNVQIGPSAAFTNDKYPRAKGCSYKLARITIKKRASIGANATILGSVNIGEYTLQ